MNLYVKLLYAAAYRRGYMAEFHLIVISNLSSLILKALSLRIRLIAFKLLIRYKSGGVKGRHTVQCGSGVIPGDLGCVHRVFSACHLLCINFKKHLTG